MTLKIPPHLMCRLVKCQCL